ncbi:hypothetical protein PAEPH01_2923, partial [Pancytospora epiphaga]
FPSVCTGQACPWSCRYSKDMLSSVFYIVIGCLNLGLNKISYPNALQVLPVILCYQIILCQYIRYNVPVFLPKLIYNCICASSLFLPLKVITKNYFNFIKYL